MAHAMPSAILDSVLNQLESPIFQNKKLCIPLHIQLKDVRSKLELIKNVMEDAELMAWMFPDVVGKWMAEFQCMLYELDSILDAALTRSMNAYSMVEKVLLPLYNMSSFHFSVAPKVKKINKRLDIIIKECRNCNLIVSEPSNCQLGGGNEKLVARKGIIRYDPKYVGDDEFYMIGIDDAKERLIKKLLDHEYYPEDGYFLDGEFSKYRIVLISGDPGAGKTTLCRAAYNDEKVMNQFDVRLWVGAGDATEIPSIYLWKTIIRALNQEAQPHLDTEKEEEDELVQLTNKIVSLIGKRKTLLVLDDFPPVSSFMYAPEVDAHWEYHLLNLITPSHKGSKILITSTKGCHTSNHIQNFLVGGPSSDEQRLALFEKTAFAPRHDRAVESLPEEWMKDMGEQIVNRCRGHPSLIKGFATLLYGKDDRATWEYFAHEIDLRGHYDDYLTPYLRSHFRQCHHHFSYLLLFSNYEFRFESLTHHFAAHGYANLSRTEIGTFKSYLLHSVQNEEDWDTTTKYVIKDHWMQGIQLFAGRESTVLELRKDVLPAAEVVRHVAIDRISSSANQQQQKIIMPDSLVTDLVQRRSLIFLGEFFPVRMSVQTLDMLIFNLQYLRVLDLHDLALEDLPNSVGKLIYLRYLDLSRNDFKVLPRSIYRLKNLQTLKLVYCDKVITLSRRIQNLRRLKHLEINMCLDLTRMPSRLTRLTRLERLDRFVVNPHIGGLRYLEDLNDLNGKLSIELPRRWENSTVDAERAKLEKKKGLTTLEFKWQGICSDHGDEDDSYVVLEKLRPCSNLENLLINKFGGTRFPGWITSLGMENQLTEITISQCKRCRILPPFHRMPKLRRLTLTSLNIEYIQDDNSCAGSNVFFPSLKHIKIGRMPSLKRWSWDLATPADGFSTIKDIITVEIWNCPCLTVMPYFSKIQSQLILQDVSKAILEFFNCYGTWTVDIISIQDLVSLHDWFSTRLPRQLVIKNCNQLQMLWEDEIRGPKFRNSLLFLSISNCPAMKHLSSDLTHMPALESLTISKCSEELDCLYKAEHGLPWLAMPRLFSLTIEGFENLVALPKGLQDWGCNWTSQILKIRDCKSLKWDKGSFPAQIKDLTIKSCPNFSKSIEELKAAYPHIKVTSED